ncbi:lambda family phage tail tape measure protein [Variovorax boronicumulans]|uniref:phage tail tape measure protein n=1 Tax=Variovorax boronicumulans TaxID=436515 RepID=UPI002785A2B9|nr:phage tail tape measure protein [Variovorax boronicumulans]MDQ0082946.1 lambda family phage tail tape measure protein [Variovorax boronicumulans]
MTDLKKQIELGVGATGVETGVAKAKRSLADLGATAVTEGKKASEGLKPIGDQSERSSAKLEAATKNMIGSIQRTTAALDAGGRSGSKYFEALAAQRGIDVSALKPYLDQLDAVNAKQRLAEQALNATAPAIQKVGVSAAQTAAALRGVPAQFTDIVTSLQGGQAPLTVFLQQGGQLKDMFGGVGPAARALGGYIASMVTPFTLAAAAVAALAVAMYQGSQEAQAYAKALTLTGNYLGLTTDQLKGMAADIAKVTGTQGEAAEALAKMAEGGKIASASMTDVGAAVVSMNRVLGTSVDKAIDVFEKLADEPAKASAKLNEQMHYLNQTTYDRIRALEDQGKKEEAAALAQSTYANATTTRLGQVEAQAGVLARAWRMLAHDAKEAWDLMQGLGRPKTTGELLADAQATLADRRSRGALNGLTGEAFEKGNQRLQEQIAGLQRKQVREFDNATAEGERTRAEAARISASDRLKTLSDEVRTNADKRKKALADLDRDFKTLGKPLAGDQYDKLVANINEKFKDPKTPKEKSVQDDAATKFLEQLRQTEASLAAQLAGEEKLTDAQKKQVEFQQLIADLKEKKILTADQKSLLANKEAISAQLDKNVALSNQIEYEKEIEKIVKRSKEEAQQFARAVEAVNISIESAQQGRAEQNDRALGAFGLGDRARQEVEAQKSIRNEFQRYLTQVNKQAAEKNQLGSKDYLDEVDRIKGALDKALAAQTAYFDALKSKQADWKNGATTALANYVDALDNVAATTEKALSSGLKGAEDALVQFVTTGKVSFSSLANSIIADLARIAIQQTITKPLANGLLDALSRGGRGGALSGDADYLSQIGLSGNSGLAITGGSGGSSLLGGIGNWLSGMKFFADGGNPPVGVPSMVGERGPELFIPSVPGTIVPNHALNGAGGNGGDTIYNLTVGDVATKSMVIEAMQTVQRQTAARYGRSRGYGGDA